MKKNWAALIFMLCLAYAGQAQSTLDTEAISEQEKTTSKIKVFPNPATNVINVLGVQNSQRAEITVSDLYGNVVLKHLWEVRNNALNIPIASLEAGIYMITVRSEEQDIKTKFYKQ